MTALRIHIFIALCISQTIVAARPLAPGGPDPICWQQPGPHAKVHAVDGDTVRYINGAVSVVFHPWKNGGRAIHLYDLYGQETYVIHEVKDSLEVIGEPVYHPNGALAETSLAYDGGMQNHLLRFGTTNVPVVRTKQMHAEADAATEDREVWFWMRAEKKWIRQEVISCQPVPGAVD